MKDLLIKTICEMYPDDTLIAKFDLDDNGKPLITSPATGKILVTEDFISSETKVNIANGIYKKGEYYEYETYTCNDRKCKLGEPYGGCVVNDQYQKGRCAALNLIPSPALYITLSTEELVEVYNKLVNKNTK
jgi:hypothetical protein